eukprot:scaffold274646_cov21-Prasinocladus_malaysianus.AAC.1
MSKRNNALKSVRALYSQLRNGAFCPIIASKRYMAWNSDHMTAPFKIYEYRERNIADSANLHSKVTQ